MTPAHRDLARHALGLTDGRPMSFRNHFVTGPGRDDFDAWLTMVADGHAWRRSGSPLTGGDDLFRLTRAGAELALEPGESLDPEYFPLIGAD